MTTTGAPATAARPCTTEPVWASGAVNRWGRFDAFIDYRWECGCGHRYNHDGRVDINAQHAEHVADMVPQSSAREICAAQAAARADLDARTDLTMAELDEIFD